MTSLIGSWGPHVTVERRAYVHHGIYVGDGDVIHYAGIKGLLGRGPVERTALFVFACGSDVLIKSASGAR